jgi:hypothetical protein
MHYIKRIIQALDVPRALVLSNLEKISALEDGGGKIPSIKNVACIPATRL